jgi:hypothetical protein
MANRYATFSTRDPLSGIFWCIAGTVGLINLGRFTSAWILWPIFFMWFYATIYRQVTRSLLLNKKGYFSGRRLNGHWVYEEMQCYEIKALILPMAHTARPDAGSCLFQRIPNGVLPCQPGRRNDGKRLRRGLRKDGSQRTSICRET